MRHGGVDLRVDTWSPGCRFQSSWGTKFGETCWSIRGHHGQTPSVRRLRSSLFRGPGKKLESFVDTWSSRANPECALAQVASFGTVNALWESNLNRLSIRGHHGQTPSVRWLRSSLLGL